MVRYVFEEEEVMELCALCVAEATLGVVHTMELLLFDPAPATEKIMHDMVNLVEKRLAEKRTKGEVMDLEACEKVYGKLIKEDEDFYYFRGADEFAVAVYKHAFWSFQPAISIVPDDMVEKTLAEKRTKGEVVE